MTDPLVQKVVDRYLSGVLARKFMAANRPLKPEALEKLLLKLRKGASSMRMQDFIRILDALGGWSIRSHMVPVPQSERYSSWREDKPHEIRASSLEDLKGRLAKGKILSRPPKPEETREDEEYFMEVSEPFENDKGQWAVTCRSWLGREGVVIEAPNGKKFYVAEPLSRFTSTYVSLPRGWNEGETQPETFWSFLEGPSNLIPEVNKRLNMPSYEQEKADKKVKPRTRANTGTCSCCFRNIKLSPKAREGKDKTLPGMVLHGYERPGHGYVEGNCFGQDWPPFELSPEGTVNYRNHLKKLLEDAEEHLSKLKSGKVTSFTTLVNKQLKVYEKDETEPREWEKMLKDRIYKSETTVKQLKDDVGRLTKAINAWKLMPLPEEGEDASPKF